MKQEFKLFSQIRNVCKTYNSKPEKESVNSARLPADGIDEDEITETLGSIPRQGGFREEEPVKIQPLKEIIYIHTDEII